MSERPNVLFIVVDDLRPQLGAYGNLQAITPNMDKLAANGTLFERAYIQQATCAPSRASVLTGLRPDSTTIYDLVTPVRQVLSDVLTLPECFKKNGYETISIGKVYHDPDDDLQGWTRAPFKTQQVTAKKGWQTPEAQAIADANPFGPPYECADVPDNAYADGKNTDHAIQVLQELKEQERPFFMAMGYHKPHLPFTAPKTYWDLYSQEDIQLAPNPFQPKGMPPFSLTPWGELRRWYGMPKGSNPMPDDEARRLIHGYYAAASYVDAQIGRLLAELDRLGLSDNTIITLFGDHGWKLGDHGAWSKHSCFEIDTRVPFMMRTPPACGLGSGRGQRISAIVELVDLYPTICDLAGLAIPPHVQGCSLAPLLADPEREWKGYAMSQFPRKPAPGGNAFVNLDQYGLSYEMLGDGIMGYGLRVERYRYVEWFALDGNHLRDAQTFLGIDAPTRELYDHQGDPLENVNVAEDVAYQDTVAQLAKQLRELLGEKYLGSSLLVNEG